MRADRRGSAEGCQRAARYRWTAAFCLAAALVLAGCADVPDNGPVQGKVAAAAGGQGQNYLQLIPASPDPSWQPLQIVYGFLAANASLAGRYAAAREYLTSSAARSWRPGLPVTVLTSWPSLTQLQPPHQLGAVSNAVVNLSGQALATLTKAGQYVGDQREVTATFTLSRVNGLWRISKPPSQLLLDEQDFQQVYQPRNLYFPADEGGLLIPDPVFEPVQATSADLASRLAEALVTSPQGWLKGAAVTAFPVRPRPRVTIDGGIATVNLTRHLGHVPRTDLGRMLSQLLWTLAGPSYGQSAIQEVRLEINGRAAGTASWSGGQPSQTVSPDLSVPLQRPDTRLYSVAPNGAVEQLSGSATNPALVPGWAGTGSVQLAHIAVSADGKYVAGVSPSGASLYYGELKSGAKAIRWSHPGGFTSLSWDARDRLFAAGPDGVWMLSPGSAAAPVMVSEQSGYHVSQFSVAPDGVRVAMIIQPDQVGGAAELKLGALSSQGAGLAVRSLVSIGTDVPDPTDITWYGADTLIAVHQLASGPELAEVPVNGAPSSLIVTEPLTQSITAAGPDEPLVAGLPKGEIAVEPSFNGSWIPQSGAGTSPAYPG